jgi:hypothetical protein
MALPFEISEEEIGRLSPSELVDVANRLLRGVVDTSIQPHAACAESPLRDPSWLV